MARGTNLSTTGWQENTVYNFDLVFTKSLIQVRVNDVLELSVTAATAGVSEFTDGSFGFYNYSQENVSYSGITEDSISVSEPSTIVILTLGLIGLLVRRRV